MEVLVTGATGFIGNHVISRLLSRGHRVIAVARDIDRARRQNWFDAVQFISCDIHHMTTGEIERFERPDAMIHLAWPGLPNYKSLFHFEDNLLADYFFLKAMVARGVTHLLVAGTCFEYGIQNGYLSEDLSARPVVPYALAKDTLRRFLEQLRQETPFVLQWARLFYLYGPGQSPASLLAQLERAIANRDAMFNMSAGEQLRDYLPVEGVAERLVTLLEHSECDGIYNICSGEPISIRRLVERHLASLNGKIQLNLGYYPYPDYEPMAFWGNPGKFHDCCKMG